MPCKYRLSQTRRAPRSRHTRKQRCRASLRNAILTAPAHAGHLAAAGHGPAPRRASPIRGGSASPDSRRDSRSTRAWRTRSWEPDPLILDDQALLAHVAGPGLVVLTGGGHAGVINISATPSA
jgi:hypothetical protein